VAQGLFFTLVGIFIPKQVCLDLCVFVCVCICGFVAIMGRVIIKKVFHKVFARQCDPIPWRQLAKPRTRSREQPSRPRLWHFQERCL